MLLLQVCIKFTYCFWSVGSTYSDLISSKTLTHLGPYSQAVFRLLSHTKTKSRFALKWDFGVRWPMNRVLGSIPLMCGWHVSSNFTFWLSLKIAQLFRNLKSYNAYNVYRVINRRSRNVNAKYETHSMLFISAANMCLAHRFINSLHSN